MGLSGKYKREKDKELTEKKTHDLEGELRECAQRLRENFQR